MNRPAKGYIPWSGQQTRALLRPARRRPKAEPFTRALEGPLPLSVYEASHGTTAVNHGLPRFRSVAFAAAYPLGQVLLSDPDVPVDVRLEAWNPLIPGDADASGIPVAVLRYVVVNKTGRPLQASVCGTLPNFIGADGSELGRDWKSDPVTTGPKKNRNEFRSADGLRGIFMSSGGVDPKHEAWGTIALAAAAGTRGSSRTAWLSAGWGTSLLDFWDDFAADGVLDPRPEAGEDMPFGSLTVELDVPAGGSAEAVFYLTWHFPNRRTWSPKGTPDDLIGNYYTTKWADAWAAAEDVAAAGGRPRSRGRSTSSGPSPRSSLPPRSRRPPCSTSARSGRRPASGRPTAASSASRARATAPAAATAPAPTSGTTSRPRPSCSARWPGPCARSSSSRRPTPRA